MLTITLISLILPSAHAQNPLPTHATLDGDMTLIRAKVAQAIRTMEAKSQAIGFEAADYRLAMKTRTSEAATRMAEFEQTMATKILAKAYAWADRYNAVFKAPDFSADERDLLLKSLRHKMDEDFKGVLKGEYAAAIGSVYSVYESGIFTAADEQDREYHNTYRDGTCTTSRNLCPEREETKYRIGYYLVSFRPNRYFKEWYAESYDHTNVKVLPIESVIPEVSANVPPFTRHFVEEISKGCLSQICYTLMASSARSYLQSVRNELDRDLTFRLADGSSITLAAVKMNLTPIVRLYGHASLQTPASLPYDANGATLQAEADRKAAQLASAAAYQRRTALDYLVRNILEYSNVAPRKYSQCAQVQSVARDLLCSGDQKTGDLAKCLISSDEQTALQNAYQGISRSRTTKLKQCLQFPLKNAGQS